VRSGKGVFRGRFFKAVLFFLCLTVVQGVFAQDSTRADTDADSVGLQQLMTLTFPDSSLTSMIDVVFEQLAFSFPSLSKEEMGRIRKQFDLSSLKQQLYSLYESSYSREEVAELLDFYALPTGQKMLATDLAVWRAGLVEGQAMAKRMIERAIAGKAQPEVQWTPFVPEDSTFTVLLPGEPSEMIIPTEMPSGVVDVHQYMTTSPYCAYIVGFADSVMSGEGVTADGVLDKVAGSVIKRVGGEVVSAVPFVSADGPGREVTLMLADGDGVYRVRLFLAGERLYQLTAVTPISEYYTSQAVHFLDSFELTPQ